KLDAHDLSFIIEGGDEHTTAFLRHPLITLNARFQLIDPLQGERTGAIVELRCGGSKLILSHAQTEIFDRLVIYALEIALREMISELFRKYALFHHMIISICRFITFIIPKTGMPVTTCLLYLLHDFLCLLPDRYQIVEPVGAVIQQNDIIFRYTECLRHLFFDTALSAFPDTHKYIIRFHFLEISEFFRTWSPLFEFGRQRLINPEFQNIIDCLSSETRISLIQYITVIFLRQYHGRIAFNNICCLALQPGRFLQPLITDFLRLFLFVQYDPEVEQMCQIEPFLEGTECGSA